MATFKKAVFKTIDAHKTPVWFATDYAMFVMNDRTILDQKSSIIEEIFDINMIKNKGLSMQTGTTQPNHSMIMIGCQKEGSQYLRWKVENSHGDDTELKGFLTMSDTFFDEYMIVAFVHKNTLPLHLRKLYKERSPVKCLPFYDILGTFA
jgi:bleomycin hydrolase